MKKEGYTKGQKIKLPDGTYFAEITQWHATKAIVDGEAPSLIPSAGNGKCIKVLNTMMFHEGMIGVNYEIIDL